MNRNGPSPILFVIHTIMIGTMLNNNGGNNGHGLKNVTCKQTLGAKMISMQFQFGFEIFFNNPKGNRFLEYFLG